MARIITRELASFIAEKEPNDGQAQKLAAVAAAAAALLTANTVAHAAVPGNTVLTGDSIVANPTAVSYTHLTLPTIYSV